jgi:SAM-dependent methyltransferase
MSGQLNLEVLDRIPLTARRVLEVGCGDGRLAAAYRAKNPLAYTYGIEMDRSLAQSASVSVSELAHTDVELDPVPFKFGGLLDCIVYDKILGTLRDPANVLRAHGGLLADGGVAVICVPNAEHWAFVARLLDGSWGHGDGALFGRQNLRWFTVRSMQRLLEEAGFTPYDVTPRGSDQIGQSAFLEQIGPALRFLQADPAEYRARSAPIELVWRARRRRASRIQVIAHMLPPQGGVSHVRIAYPLSSIGTDPDVIVRIISDQGMPPVDPVHPKILLLHRLGLAGTEAKAFLKNAIANGYIIVMEFDDHPDFFANMQSDDLLSFRGVHAIQTTTPALGEIFRQRNPNVAIFPNAVKSLLEPRNYSDPDRMRIFFGAFNREADWRDLMPALAAVANRAGPRLQFDVMHDRAFFEALPSHHKSFLPISDYATYQERLAQAEISFMPLSDTPFNRAKSDLKFVEAAAARVVAIASRTVYQDSISHGKTGFLFENATDLHDNLMYLLVDAGRGRQMADRARGETAAKRMQAYQVADRLAWYRYLCDNRDYLTAELLKRAPELRTA